MSVISELQEWFRSQCDGSWEHDSGITIQSCDNPGWWVKIQIAHTTLSDKPFTRIADGLDRHGDPIGKHWICCHVTEGVWHGAGDLTKLETILRHFLQWANRKI